MEDSNKIKREKNISLEILVVIDLLIISGALILKFLNPFVVNYTEAIKKADIFNFLFFGPIIVTILSIIIYRSLKPIRTFTKAEKPGLDQLMEIRKAAFDMPLKITVQFLVVILSIVAFAAFGWDAFFFKFYPFLDRLVSMGLIWAYTICTSLVVFVYIKSKMIPVLRATSGIAEDKGFRFPIKVRFIITTLTLSSMMFLFTFVYSVSRLNYAFWYDEVEAGKSLLNTFKKNVYEFENKRELKEHLKSMPSKGPLFVVNSDGEYIAYKPDIIPDDFDIKNRLLTDPEGTARIKGVPGTALRILPLEKEFAGLYAGTVITLEPNKQNKLRFTLFFLIAMGCFLVIFIAVISYCVAFDISTAIKDVTGQMGKISDKKESLYKEGKITSLDEVGDLIRSFNTLQRVVNSYHQELDKVNKKILGMERMRADEAVHDYRLLAENITDVIFTVDPGMRVTYISPSVQRLRDYSTEESLRQGIRKWFTVNSLNDARKAFTELIKVVDKGSKEPFMSRTLELEVTCKGDRTVWTEARMSPLLDPEECPIGTLCILRDITERKKMEEEMLKIEKLEAVGVLAAGIAHDFNNLLTAVIGNLSIAELSAKHGDDIFEPLLRAKNASWQAGLLTKQLLTFSKGGAPIKEAASIKELIKETANFALRGCNTKCETTFPDDLWPVEIDKGQISQVINNLIINASQAMPEGGIIRIYAENMSIDAENGISLKEGKYVKISVKDQGIGIPQEYLDKIFDPYFTTKQTGSGLGLATSYSIIKSHGGYLHTESNVGKGTTFSIYLPVSEKENFVVSGIHDEKDFFYGRGKILIMDDQKSIREMAQQILIKLGYEVECARDGDEAIRLYKIAKESGESFDAVILDLTIAGGMGGKETIRKLHEIDTEVKAIVSSGYSSDPIMSNYQIYGFCGVVAKPYKLSELSKVLFKVINGKEEPSGTSLSNR